MTSNGITISVITAYLPMHSDPKEDRFIFGYEISIKNESGSTVQLLRRRWNIRDADGHVREVEGEGVVGMQPILEPGDEHQYTSFCNLYTEIGRMWGAYTMYDLEKEKTFEARVPQFEMVVPEKLN